MKLKTHYVFSTGLITLLNVTIIHNLYVSLFLAGAISVIGNSLIDRLGHEMVWYRNEYIPKRTPLTHTVPRSVLWGLISALPLLALVYYFYPHRYFLTDAALLTVDGVIVGPSHMVLDMFTERGIYVKKGGKWRRFALAHFSYNDPAVNNAAILLGVLMLIAAAFWGRG